MWKINWKKVHETLIKSIHIYLIYIVFQHFYTSGNFMLKLLNDSLIRL